jgi:hypothetical protein
LISSIGASIATSVKVNLSDKDVEYQRLKEEKEKKDKETQMKRNEILNKELQKTLKQQQQIEQKKRSQKKKQGEGSSSLVVPHSSSPPPPPFRVDVNLNNDVYLDPGKHAQSSSSLSSSSSSSFPVKQLPLSISPNLLTSFSNWSSKGPIHSVLEMAQTAIPIIPPFPLRIRFIFTNNKLADAFVGVQVFLFIYLFIILNL